MLTDPWPAIKHDLPSAHPESIVTQLLQHALAAARHALIVAHPEIGGDFCDIRDVDQSARLAFLLAVSLVDLDCLLDTYHRALRSHHLAARIDQLDLPF